MYNILNRPSIICFLLARPDRVDAGEHSMTNAQLLNLCPIDINPVIRLRPSDTVTYTLFASVHQESGPHFLNFMWSSINRVYKVNDDKVSVASSQELLESKHKAVLLFYKSTGENSNQILSFDSKTERICLTNDTMEQDEMDQINNQINLDEW